MKERIIDNRVLTSAIQHRIKEEHSFVEDGKGFNGSVSEIHRFSIDTCKQTLTPPCLNISGTWSSELRIAREDKEDPDGIIEKPYQVECNEFNATLLTDEVQDIGIGHPINVKSL